MLLDSHTHTLKPDAIVNSTGTLDQEHYWSVGLHPWRIPSDPEEAERAFAQIEEQAQERNVLAIGECGLDVNSPVPYYRQLQWFKRQAELAERTGKPLIVHDVKSHEGVIAVHKELRPKQPWILHGFRGKPAVAKMLQLPGIHFSFGEKFNPETVRELPAELILAETDEYGGDVSDIISALSEARGEELGERIAENTKNIFL